MCGDERDLGDFFTAFEMNCKVRLAQARVLAHCSRVAGKVLLKDQWNWKSSVPLFGTTCKMCRSSILPVGGLSLIEALADRNLPINTV